MSIVSADRVRVRELWHAYNITPGLRAGDPQVELVLAKGKASGDALFAVVSKVLAEEADDPPLRLARGRAAGELRTGAIAALRRIEALVMLRATDARTGEVTDQPALDRVAALHREYLPKGTVGGLAADGPALLMQAGLVRDALSREPDGQELAAHLGGLVARHREALERVGMEAEQLATVRKTLEEARAHADLMRRAGWHYLQFLQSWSGQPINLSTIYPVSDRSRTRASEEANAVLDEAGAPPLPDEPAPAEPTSP